MAYLNSKFQSGFSPQNIPGLVVWLDANDSNSITQSGGAVSLWKDRSPNALDVSQNTGAAQPTYESNVQNGLPALRFTTSQMMQSTQNFTVDKAQTWFVSFKALAGANFFFFEQGPNTNTNDGQFLYGGNNSLMYMKRGAATRFIDDSIGRGTSPFALNTWYVAGLSTANTNGGVGDTYWSINGVPRATTLTSVIAGTATNALYINNTARVPASNYYGEIIIYNQALSSNQMRLVERYLATKWGVTLSNTHPYFSVPSSMRFFNPLDISGLASWFDAADTRRMTLSGSNVNSWGDKANMDNSMNFVGTAGTLVSNSTNYPCVRFSGTSVYQSTLSNLTRANYFSDTSTCTMFAVVNTSNTSGTNGLFWNFVSTTNVANRVAIFTTPPSTLFWDAGGIAAPRQTTGLTLTTNSVRLYMFQRAGIVLNFREFGALTSSNVGASTATIANDNYRITMSESGAAWTGDIHEILWYNRTLPDIDTWRIEQYLAEKWGVRGSLTSNSPMRFYESLSPVFNPTVLPNCSLWLDAADSNTFTFSSSSNISQWNDKSGNGYSMIQPTLANQPTLTSAAQNGLAGIQLQSNLFLYQVASNMSNFTAGTEMSLFAVVRNAAANSGWNLISTTWFTSTGTNGTTRYHFSFNQFTTPGVSIYLNGAFIGRAATVAPSSNSIVGFATSAGSTTLHVDGSYNTFAGSTLPNASATSTYVIIGDNRNDPTASSNSMMFEMIGYSSQLPLSQRQLVERYLAQKWGLVANLPNNHAYKSIPV